MSVAHANRRQLESLGEYVTRANVDWFAVFPDKLIRLNEVAATHDRPTNLIVYRNRSMDERDHHVIPWSEIAGLFVNETLTHSDVNGTTRWNVTLKDHVLRVSHSDRSVDVSSYFRAPLAIEEADSDRPSRPVDFEPARRIEATTYRILRDTETARRLKSDHQHCCQMCGTTTTLPDGSRYAEAHHIRPLGSPHHGPDRRENMVVLCPNHHAMCDYGVLRLMAEDLRQIDGHVIDRAFVAYHNDNVFRDSTPRQFDGAPVPVLPLAASQTGASDDDAGGGGIGPDLRSRKRRTV